MDFTPAMNRTTPVAQAITIICGRVVTSTSGTISSYDVRGGACTVAKTGGKTGRYTITLTAGTNTAVTKHVFLSAHATLVGPDDAALTTTKGVIALIRDIDIGEGADDGTVEIQWVQSAVGGADTEVQDSASFTFVLFLGHKDF